jgi:hypothetical protein
MIYLFNPVIFFTSRRLAGLNRGGGRLEDYQPGPVFTAKVVFSLSLFLSRLIANFIRSCRYIYLETGAFPRGASLPYGNA